MEVSCLEGSQLRCSQDAGSGQPALGSRSEGQRDVMTLKSCCWGKWYQPCTQPAELDRSCGPFCKFLCLSTMT
ncbi:hypothetical protein AV530_019548 [Patagioenas fasciata monilis]|uniref:Uncharacterized protein n=1 Tax=Patagioenas fasciata monilis TaxID=372326 RepID=A0A1V4JDW2_PATFA|nr:hypothetical protein AV530_019548 [Patagioenas fasciata monilis]